MRETVNRAELLELGFLVDISKTAVDLGLFSPVAVSEMLWKTYIKPDSNLIEFGQTTYGRTQELLKILLKNVNTSNLYYEYEPMVSFDVMFLTFSEANEPVVDTVNLLGIFNLDDISEEPVITIIMQDELGSRLT